METSVKQRLIAFIKYKNLSQKRFEVSVGLSNGYVNNIRQSITPDKLQKIALCFPDLNKAWILTGEGDMLKSDNRNGVVSINQSQIHDYPNGTPVLDIDVTCGKEFRDLRDERVIGYVDLPIIRNDSYIVTATGDSMSPKVLSGDFIVIREIKNRDYFLWGHMYLVVTPEYRMLKYIEKHPTDQKEHIVLRSENEAYSDIELPIKDIFKLFVVENIISINNL